MAGGKQARGVWEYSEGKGRGVWREEGIGEETEKREFCDFSLSEGSRNRTPLIYRTDTARTIFHSVPTYLETVKDGRMQ